MGGVISMNNQQLFLDLGIQERNKYFQAVFEMVVVRDIDVGVVFERLDVFFVGRRHVVGVAVKHIFQIVAALYFVADNAAVQFYVFLGIYVNFQVEQARYFFEIENEN